MKILVVGGGSGGHVTPVVAVIAALKAHRPRVEIRFWCDTAFATQVRSILDENGYAGIPVTTIMSGKFRRYHGVTILKQLRDITTVLKNVRDAFKFLAGFLQSLVLLVLWRPDAVFTKGGFVCLPVGLAAHVLRIPLVIHESDAHSGLTNRILARYATSIGTGSPLKSYSFPPAISRHVGIPIGESFVPQTPAQTKAVKRSLGLPEDRPLVLVTGGGLGAKRINDAMMAIGPELLDVASVIHVTGSAQFEEIQGRAPHSPLYRVLGFVSKDMDKMMGASDIVVSRAGATTLLELAALARPTVLIPNGMLTGGHQLKNAEVYREADAAVLVSEEDLLERPALLLDTLRALFKTDAIRSKLSKHIHAFAKPHAAEDVAEMIIEASGRL